MAGVCRVQAGRGLTGESSTDPTEFMFVRSKNSSPILRMISVCGHAGRGGQQIQEPDGDSAVGATVRRRTRTRAPLWGMFILPVSLIISGMSFVSSMVDEMSSSNCEVGWQRR